MIHRSPISTLFPYTTLFRSYIGDYIGNSPIKNTSYAVWMDGRNNSLGSYTAYYPDFAMNVNPPTLNLNNGDSITITAKVPAIKGDRKSTRLNSSHVAISYAV